MYDLWLQFGTPAHEIGHSLGMYHTQEEPDRDKYVDVFINNIAPGYESQYEIVPSDQIETKNLPYDYGSIMHYGVAVSNHLFQHFS